MKKAYVVPESKLFSININENIAGSDNIYSGEDSLSANVSISFTQLVDNCRGLYSGYEDAPVVKAYGDTFKPYYDEILEYGKTNPVVYWNCFRYIGW